jgi:GntR family histidine utilization transcriptional repressor
MITLPNTASPLYEKVKDYILHNIGSGAWPSNQRLPSENDLVASLGVSRMTVHRALRELSSVGLLTRVQGVGTFVSTPKPRSGLLEINNIAAEITERGQRHASKVVLVETITTPSYLTKAFEFEGRRKVFHSVVVHFENEDPVQHEERFVNPDLVPAYDKQDYSKKTTFDYLMQSTPVTELEHLISAIPADANLAGHLKVAIGEPCLLLQRRTWSGTAVATVSRLVYVGSRYSLGTRYNPASVQPRT